MNTELLTSIGLTPIQAAAYALLIEHGEVKPSEAADLLKTTRTNAYKVFDKLAELKLAAKKEVGKKFVYAATHPLALSTLASTYRAEAAAREEAAAKAIQELLEKHQANADQPNIETASGAKAVADLFRKQLSSREDIVFIHSPVDVTVMGFDTMHDLRITPSRHGKQRQAIMSEPPSGGVINYAQHKRSNLEITWAAKDLYTAPVEWSVTDSSLLIVIYGSQPHAILIANPLVAMAFKQLWQMTSSLLAKQPVHQKLTPKGKE